jgi:DNA replication protein DnaC
LGNSYPQQDSNLVPATEASGIISRCGEAPKPTKCKFCGKLLYHSGVVFPALLTASGEPEIMCWTKEPERCDCEEAVKHWQKHDAEVERKRKELADIAERARQKARVDRLLSESGIKKRFLQRTFDSFICDTQGRKQAYKIAREYAENFEEALASGEGLYIEGTYGTGKTHLAAAIAIYLTEREYSVVMKTSFELFEEIKRTFNGEERTEAEVVTAYRDCDLLIIDDLGKEQCTDWSMSVLYSIVNDRYEAMKPIIITTNFNSHDLIRAMTPRGYGSQKIGAIISRLREVSQPITMAWQDFRSE